jgi:hypothetical protein
MTNYDLQSPLMALSRTWNRQPNRSATGSPGRAGLRALWSAVFNSRTAIDPRFIGHST